MTRSAITTSSITIAMVVALVGAASAQTPPITPSRPAVEARPVKPIIPLKVLIVVTRYDGDKKIASLPYSLWVNANGGSQTSLNMGVRVATPNGGTSITYNPIGTNITCSAKTLDDGQFSVDLVVDESSMLPDKSPGLAATLPGVPSFQMFTLSNTVVLKDGQTVQYASATDPATGQVTKIDLTVTTIK